MAVYAGMITGMDRNIGRLVSALRASGQLDNTLLLFMSDNGACAEWEPFGFEMAATPEPGARHRASTKARKACRTSFTREKDLARMGGPGTRPSYGSGWANACNTPWRLYKHYDHEGGISSPFIVHWPAGFSAKGEFRTQVGHLIDLMTTCVDVAGAKYPVEFDGHPILPAEGISLLPALANEPLPREFLAWEHEGNRAIREGHWKLVSLAGAPWELYDMDTDRVELHDLAAEEPERVKSMSAKWDAWAIRTHVLPRPGDGKKAGVD